MYIYYITHIYHTYMQVHKTIQEKHTELELTTAKERMDHIRGYFVKLDTDGSGLIDKMEFRYDTCWSLSCLPLCNKIYFLLFNYTLSYILSPSYNRKCLGCLGVFLSKVSSVLRVYI